MNRLLTAAAIALSLSVAPAFSMGLDVGTLTPVLSFPDPQPEPVTKDATSFGK